MKYYIHILSNTHWDREWYMPHEKYLVRLVKLCDRLLDIMEVQPEYIFIADGQFSMIDDYLQVRPENIDRVKKLVKEGRLEVGPWFTQPLQTLASGESLIRNLHYGIEGSEKLGRAMRFSYEIDEFGHASQMPQIYQGFGIDGSMAWRGMPKGCRSAFRWEAPDGSAVIMLYSHGGYGEATSLPSTHENFTENIDGVAFGREGLLNRVNNLVNFRADKADIDQLFWLNGIDHSFPQHDILSVIEEINCLFPELTVKQTTLEACLEAIKDAYARTGASMMTVEGELMYTAEEILESTHSCHTRQKLRHYQAERYLDRVLEPTLALNRLAGGDDMEWASERAWKYVLENHAHDTLGCTSVDTVFEEAMGRYGKSLALAEQTAEGARRDVMARMAEGNALVVFNTTAFSVSGVRRFVLDIPAGYGDERLSLKDEDGNEVALHILSTEPVNDIRYNPRTGHPTQTKAVQITALIDLPVIPAFGWRRFSVVAGGALTYMRNRPTHYLATAPGVMENDYLCCRIQKDGTVELTDKVTGKVYPNLFTFEDCGEEGNVYQHIPPVSGQTVYSLGASARCALLYDTPLGCSYEVKVSFPIPEGKGENGCRSRHEVPMEVILHLTLKKEARYLECEMELNNMARDHRLRVLFPTELLDASVTRGGQPFDFPQRKIHEPAYTEGVFEQPYATHPMQDICDVTGEENGLMIAAEGIYEYECIDDQSRALALTVLRANNMISTLLGTSGQYDLREAENLCRIRHRMAIIPHGAAWREAYPDAIRFLSGVTVTLNRAPEESVLTDYVKSERILPSNGSMFALAGKDLLITAVKNTYYRDTVTVRVLNMGEHDAEGTLRMTFPGLTVKAVYATDLDEKRGEQLAVAENGVTFTLRKAGLATFEFETK